MPQDTDQVDVTIAHGDVAHANFVHSVDVSADGHILGMSFRGTLSPGVLSFMDADGEIITESPPCEMWSSVPRVDERVRDKLQDQEGVVIGHTTEVRPIVRWDDGTERSRSADDLERITAP